MAACLSAAWPGEPGCDQVFEGEGTATPKHFPGALPCCLVGFHKGGCMIYCNHCLHSIVHALPLALDSLPVSTVQFRVTQVLHCQQRSRARRQFTML